MRLVCGAPLSASQRAGSCFVRVPRKGELCRSHRAEKRCTAETKYGTTCALAALPGRDVCKLHEEKQSNG